MSFNTFFPPYKARVVDENNKLTPAWRTFISDVFNTVGGSQGDIILNSSSILSLDSNFIELSSGGFKIKGLTIPSNSTYTANTVVTQSSNLMSFSTTSELNLSPTTGQVIASINSSHDSWLLMNDGTIGSAASPATTRANNDCEELFTLLWNQVSDTYAPVSGGRGATAALDWAANKTLTLTPVLGRIIHAAGESTAFTNTAQGETYGVEQVAVNGVYRVCTGVFPGPVECTYYAPTYPSHTHTFLASAAGGLSATITYRSGAQDDVESVGGITSDSGYGPVMSDAEGNIGSEVIGDAHNNMMKTCFLNYFIKL